jgi:hypothetical protein
MTLRRDWIASPNFSSRGGSGVRLIVLHTAEGSRTYQSLGSYFQGDVGVSSHVGIDDTPDVIGEYVRAGDKAWTQANANPYCVAAELCAFAAWTTAEWDQHPQMLENAAAWVAEEAARFGIPLVEIGSASAQGGGTGVCDHVDLGAAGGGHWDCGNGFPMGRVVEMAGGKPGTAPSPGPPSGGGLAPPFPGTLLRNFTTGHGTGTWQHQMAIRGWIIDVDDLYGGQSEDVCMMFQREKGLAVDGIVGPITWDAAWTAPIT